MKCDVVGLLILRDCPTVRMVVPSLVNFRRHSTFFTRTRRKSGKAILWDVVLLFILLLLPFSSISSLLPEAYFC